MLLLKHLVMPKDLNWFIEPLMMDLKQKIYIEHVITKEALWVFLKQKLEMEDRSKYLDGTLISSGHHLVNGNQGLGIHFYFIQEMTWTWSKLYAQIKKKKFIIMDQCYVVLEGLIWIYCLVAISAAIQVNLY